MFEIATRIVTRHWGKMAILFVVILGAVVAVTFLTPKTYASEAKLFVRLGRENVTLDPTTTFGQAPVVAVPPSREADMGTIMEIVRSRVQIEEVVDRVGVAAILGDGPPVSNTEPARDTRFDLAVRTLAKGLNVEAIKKSNMLLISFEGPSPETAQAVVSALVELATARHIRLNRNPRAHDFLSEQTARLSKELAARELKLREMKQETGLFSPEAQRQAAVARIARLQDDQLQTTGSLAATEKEVQLLREQLGTVQPSAIVSRTTGIPSAAEDGPRAQLRALELRELDLVARYSPEHPEVKLLRKQIETARERFTKEDQATPREQVTTGPNKLHDDLQLALLQKVPNLAAIKARLTTLDTQLREEKQALSLLVENELRLTQEQREVDRITSNYRKYAENLEQTQIDRALEEEKISNLSVAQAATYDPLPVRPRVTTNLGLGLLFALAACIALGWILESRSGSPSVA